eukprot:g847.t1
MVTVALRVVATNSFKRANYVHDVVLAKPLDACPPDLRCTALGGKEVPCERRVVLATRGGCPFYRKYLNLLRASGGMAQAVWIADSDARGPRPLLKLLRGQAGQEAALDELEVAHPDVPAAAVPYAAGQWLARVVNGSTHKALGGMRFSEHQRGSAEDPRGEHSWQHKVREYDAGVRLLRQPASARAWAALAEAVAAQSQARAAEAQAARAVAVALKRHRKSRKGEEL